MTKPKLKNPKTNRETKKLKNNSSSLFNNRLLISFIIVFGIIGMYFVFQAGAAPKRSNNTPTAPAVTLSISPSSQTFRRDQTASLAVNVNTNGQSVNAAEATVNYPADKFDFVSITATGSAFEIETPVSTTTGSVTFARATTTPVNSSNALLGTINLRPKAGGRKVPVTIISNSSLVLRHGDSENILERVSGGIYTIR